MSAPIETDYLVLGSGIAGLNFALRAAAHGRVLVVCKTRISDTNTNWAQGGVAAVQASDDSLAQHVADTLTVGDGLCDPAVVDLCVAEGPAQVERLLQLGVQLDRGKDGALDLTREGGHSQRRVVHYADVTGREIQRALIAAVAREPNITVLEEHIAVDLLSMAKYGGDPACFGAYVLDRRSAGDRRRGQGVPVHVEPRRRDGRRRGDGLPGWARKIANMEFYQFHPTCLYHPDAKSFLISEALRGEGGPAEAEARPASGS
jgi:L-aspartate oxidase